MALAVSPAAPDDSRSEEVLDVCRVLDQMRGSSDQAAVFTAAVSVYVERFPSYAQELESTLEALRDAGSIEGCRTYLSQQRDALTAFLLPALCNFDASRKRVRRYTRSCESAAVDRLARNASIEGIFAPSMQAEILDATLEHDIDPSAENLQRLVEALPKVLVPDGI